MKAIKMRIQKSSRLLVILLTIVVGIITSVVVANATQTITTPNAAFISYNLAAGAQSAAITPVTNKSVQVMGCCITSGDPGVGQVSLLHLPSLGMVFVGLNSTANAAITQSGGITSLGPVVFIDFNHQVFIRVASADTIAIFNNSTGTRAGNMTLIR